MTLELQPLFPLALAQAQLRLDPLDLAVMLQEVLALRGAAEGNPHEGCAWTGDINGIWQLHQLPPFAAVCDQLRRHSWRYLEQLGFDTGRLALHIQRARRWGATTIPMPTSARSFTSTAMARAAAAACGCSPRSR